MRSTEIVAQIVVAPVLAVILYGRIVAKEKAKVRLTDMEMLARFAARFATTIRAAGAAAVAARPAMEEMNRQLHQFSRAIAEQLCGTPLCPCQDPTMCGTAEP